MRCVLILMVVGMGLQAGVVDRLAITVGSTVITELQIDEDLRVAALLNEQPVPTELNARRDAADRLVEQILLRHEIEISRYPGPSEEEIAKWYANVEQTMGGSVRLGELLAKYEVSELTLRTHLTGQLSTLSFIRFRFRPTDTITDSEIAEAYQQQIAALRQADLAAKIPPLDENEKAKVTELVLEERTDAALTAWLAESRKQINIRYIDVSLQ